MKRGLKMKKEILTMFELYEKSIMADFINSFNQDPEKGEVIKIYYSQDIEDMNAGKLKSAFPCIIIEPNPEISIKINEVSISETNQNEQIVPIDRYITLSVMSRNNNEVDELVNTLLCKYNSMQYYTVALPIESKKEISFGVAIYPDYKSERFIKNEIFFTHLLLKSEGCVLLATDEAIKDLKNITQSKNQTETVKKVLDLEKAVAEYTKKLSDVKLETFHKNDEPPTHNIIQRTYPPIVSQIKFNWLIALLPLIAAIIMLMFIGLLIFTPFYLLIFILDVLLFPFGIIWIPVYYISIHKKKKNNDVERMRNSVEYKNHCAFLDSEYDKKQEEADALYQSKKQEYETVILPKYKKDLDEWKTAYNTIIAKIKSNLEIMKCILEHLHKTTNIVSVKYRNVKALGYIYDIISTHEHDITYAINSYEIKLQKEAEMYRSISGAIMGAVNNLNEENRRAREEYYEERAYQRAQNSSETSKPSRPAKGADGSGRQNLFGTAACRYGQKDENGWTIHCASCPLSFHCTRRGYYKVGD